MLGRLWIDIIYPRLVKSSPCLLLLKITTLFKGVANGTILIGKIAPYNWTSSEKKLLKNFAKSVANAIAILQLQQKARIGNSYQTLVKDIGQAILQGYDLNSIFNLALAAIAKTLEVDRALILMLKYKEPLLKKTP